MKDVGQWGGSLLKFSSEFQETCPGSPIRRTHSAMRQRCIYVLVHQQTVDSPEVVGGLAVGRRYQSGDCT
jgi:uncharacterized protein YcfJ